MKTISSLIVKVSKTRPRGKWRMAVKDYTLDLLGNLYEAFQWDRDKNRGPRTSDRWMEENCPNVKMLHRKLLNGAPDWHEYSWGGCALIYNDDLAKNLLTKSELKSLGWKEDSKGELYGGRSEWGGGSRKGCSLLDAQTRALMQAESMVAELAFGPEAASDIFATSIHETDRYYGKK